MLQIDGANDLLLTCEDVADGVAILRCETRDPAVRLPDEIGGRPVTALGEYALSARAPGLTGRQTYPVRVSCGGPAPVHDAGAVTHVTLPEHLTRVGRYVFYNCRNLQSLSLAASVTDFSGGALMNCTALRAVTVRLAEGAPTCLQRLLGEHAGELDVCLAFGEQQARLLFPAYSEDLQELFAPHIFQRRIEGAGYAYRQCFERGVLQFAQYDGAFYRLLQTHAFDVAARVASCRLRWPFALSAQARAQYLDCLRAHGGALACNLAARGETQALAFLLSLGVLPRQDLGTACDAARRHGHTETLTVLLDAVSRQPHAGLHKTFDL